MRLNVMLCRNFASCIAILLVLHSFQRTAFAQEASAGLSITVSDPSGALVPDASVVIRNADTNQEQRANSGKRGSSQFSYLKPGHYKIIISKSGFVDLAVDNILLNLGDEKVLQLVLKVGSAAQTVTVDGSGLNLNTTDGSVSTVVDRNFVENMPLNGRSFQDLILLTPGVVTNTPQSAGASGATGEFSINGQRTESNVYTVDGVNANTGGYLYGYGTSGTSGSIPAATALGTTQSLVSVDDLQEFRVNSSSYSAEYGLSPGGQFSFETRSGTNDLHGTLFDYLRNDAFDANNWFDDATTPLTPKPAERQNDFGGTFGGPAWFPKLYNGKNKSFLFFSYEGLRLTEPHAALTTYVPSTSLREAAPPALRPLLNAFPVPTGAALSNGLAPFVGAYSAPASLDSTSIRFDQQLGAKTKVFFRFSDTQSASKVRNTGGFSEIDAATQSSYTNTLGITTSFSEASANDFRFNYTSNVGRGSSTLDAFGGAIPANFIQLQGINTATNPDASAAINLYFPGYSLGLQNYTTTQPQHAFNVNDSVTFAYRNHLLKVGMDFRRISSQLIPRSPLVSLTFNSSTSVSTNTSEYGIVEVTSNSYPAYSNLALYIQDELRATHRLNLSFGLRWELNPPPSSTSGALPYIVQGNLHDPAGLTLAPQNTPFWKTTYFNFAPRIGLAYRAHDEPGHETILRAGGGVFFDSGQQNSTQAFGQSPGQIALGVYGGASFPLTPTQVNLTIANPPTAPYLASGYYFPARQQLPYTLQWNTSIEQALGKTQALTISYVGSNGRRLLSQQYSDPSTGAFADGGLYLENSGTPSSYNALQAKCQRALSRGLQVLASYNWSHSIDFGSQDLDYAQVRGNSDYDSRNNLNFAVTYELPKTNSSPIVDKLANNWLIDGRVGARTAFPVILDGDQITLPNGESTYQGLDLVPNVPVYRHLQGIPGNREINPAAFAFPAGDAYGNAPRNFARGFGMNQVDLAVRRSFSIVDKLNLQFRAEMFNIFNHPNFGYIEPLFGNPQFGQATKTLNESLGNLSPLYQQGGPRSMQLSMKVVF
jgi:hypothetical protein